MKIAVNSPCFICNSLKSELLFETEYPMNNYPGAFSIWRCSSCGLLFNSPRLNDAQIAKMYDSNYYFFNRSDSDEFRRIADVYLRTVALVADTVSENKAIEIGSAKGYLLALLKHLHWTVQGIELSASAAEYAQSRFGVPTFTGTVGEYSESSQSAAAPLVLAIDVLEHIPNPADFIGSVNKIIKKNGVLIIDTPNGSSFNIGIKGVSWKGFNPFHIYFFSRNNLEQLLTKMNFAVEKVFSYGNTIESNPPSQKKAPPFTLPFLQEMAIVNKAKAVYGRFKSLKKEQNDDVLTLLKKTTRTIEKNVSYFAGKDSGDSLSENTRGDNLVVIARKK
jgi:2-polyprenyl-3-methyl-5-hydroxy-6-metoxy-1,4-benzoquinol methylase